MSSVEPVIRQYAAAFDGTAKPFPSNLFDALFATKFHITKEEYNPDFYLKLENKYSYETIDREQVKKTHEAYMAKGTTLTLEHCNEIGMNSIDVSFLLKNVDEETKVRIVFTIKDKQLLHGRTADSTTSVLRAQVDATLSMWGKLVKDFGLLEGTADHGADMNTYKATSP